MTESVWDYPRPPRVEPLAGLARVEFGGMTIAFSRSALRVLETSHPPSIYFPPGDVRLEFLTPAGGATVCEWKGRAAYFDAVVGSRRASAVGWTYKDPLPGYRILQDHVAFYPGRVDSCHIDGELVRAQPGDFYGGWITDGISGPFKGDPGTTCW